MKVIRHTDANFAARLRETAAASSLFDPVIEQRTQTILEAVKTRRRPAGRDAGGIVQRLAGRR